MKRTEADTAVSIWQVILLMTCALVPNGTPVDGPGWAFLGMIFVLMLALVAACTVWERSLGFHERNGWRS